MSIRIFKPDPTIVYKWLLRCFNCGNCSIEWTQEGRTLQKEDFQCKYCNTADDCTIESCEPLDDDDVGY